jgi:outer membrane protein assembly factor BamB
LWIILAACCATAARGDENWPEFRGPRGDGSSDAVGLPLRWGENENVKWKTPIHDRGWSSPVVWGNQVWMTTATADGKRLYAVCVARDSGKIVHDILVFDDHKPEWIHSLNSYASPTPVVEAGRVYVHFGTYGTACLDSASGQEIWTRRDLHCNHFRGPGSSPALVDNLLFLHFDGFDVQYVVALDKQSGKTAWKVDRSTDFAAADGDLRKAFSTPLVIGPSGQQQLISAGSRAAMAYDPQTGKELWKVNYPIGFSTTSRPLLAAGMVVVSTGSGRSELWALRPDGRGDVTKSHVAWKVAKAMPFKTSPTLADGLLFTVNDGGIATCIEARSGEIVWQQRLDGQYSASPLAAEGRVYFFSHEGKTTVIEAGRTYKELAVNTLPGGFMASPAVSGKALFLRTTTHLYRIE